MTTINTSSFEIIKPEEMGITVEEMAITTANANQYVGFPSDLTTQDQMNAIDYSGCLDFWDDPEENIY